MERESHQFIGQSGAFLDAVERASRAAPMQRPVLVIGERGTGKELIAERLHRLSNRWEHPLIIMNCAALPETLIEAELFGHEAGSFTGATRARAGRFEEADRGTLFLDEIGTLSMAAQERLLRAVEYGEINRIGSSRPERVDVRIVAATNENLPALAEDGRFRADLLDRLCFEVITLPPLRVREGDIDVLADYFGRRMAAELGWESWPGFAPHVRQQLDSYPWPGNVRELRNIVHRAYVMAPDSTIVDECLPTTDAPLPAMTGAPMLSIRVGTPLAEIERQVTLATLEYLGRHKEKTAATLGVSLKTLYNRLKEYSTVPPKGESETFDER